MSQPPATTTSPATSAHSARWRDRKGIARHFGISERSVGNLMRRRFLPYVKLGRIVRFDLNACESAVKAFERQSVAQHRSMS